MSYCSPRSFHSSCLLNYARTLAELNPVPWEKVQWLLNFCPNPKDKDANVLSDDNLSGVVALGLFAVKSQLKHHGKEVLSYLLDLMRSLPSGQWIQNVTAEARKEGLIAERYCFKLTLILLALATLKKEEEHTIIDVTTDVLFQLAIQFQKLEEKSSDEAALIVLPTLLGMVWAFQGNGKWRIEQLGLIFTGRSSGFMETNDHLPFTSANQMLAGALSTTEVAFLKQYAASNVTLKTQQVEKLMKIVFAIIGNSGGFQALDKKMKEFRIAHPSHFYNYQSAVLKNLMLSMSCTISNLCPQELPVQLHQKVVRLGENYVNSGLRELSPQASKSPQSSSVSSSSATDTYHVVVTTSTAVVFWATAVKSESECDDCFQRISSLLVTMGMQSPVLLAILRTACCKALALLTSKCYHLCSLTLECLKGFLLSKILQKMSEDVNATSATTPQDEEGMTKSLSMSAFTTGGTIHLSRSDMFNMLRDQALTTLCSVINVAGEKQVDVVQAFVSSLGSQLYTTASDHSNCDFETIIIILQKCAETLEIVRPNVLSVFQQVLFHRDPQLDILIVNQLGKFGAKTGDTEALQLLYRLILLSLAGSHTTYRQGVASKDAKQESDNYTHIAPLMVKVLGNLASELEGDDLLLELLSKVLELFVQQGLEASKVQNKVEINITGTSFSQGFLLPVLATILMRMENSVESTVSLLNRFIEFWFYCVVTGFTEFEKNINVVYPQKWYGSIKAIAMRSPYLFLGGSHQSLHTDLEVNHPSRKYAVKQPELIDSKRELLELVDRTPELERHTNSLSYVQVMYLRSVYRLEAFRMEEKGAKFSCVFKYLEEAKRSKSSAIFQATSAIAAKLHNKYLSILEGMPVDKERNYLLEAHAELLLFQFNNISTTIRAVADSYLVQLLDKFDYLFHSKTIIFVMLDLLQLLSEHVDVLGGSKMSNILSLPGLPYTITFPDDTGKRLSTATKYAQRCEQFLKAALGWNYKNIRSILIEYVCDAQLAGKGIFQHTGASLVMAQLNDSSFIAEHIWTIPSQILSGFPNCLKETQSQIFSIFFLRSRFTGEINGVLNLNAILGKGKQNCFSSYIEHLSSELKRALKGDNVTDITSALYRLTAVMLSNKAPDRSLLRLLVWEPVQSFKKIAIQIAIGCWEWMLVARPELEYSLLQEFIGVWRWTIYQRWGVYSLDNSTDNRGDTSMPSAIQHQIMTKFLSQRFKVMKKKDIRQVILIKNFLYYMFPLSVGPNSKQLISHHVATIGVRFRLLRLAVRLLQGNVLEDEEERGLLREKIYANVLDYFCYHMMWPTGEDSVLRSDIIALIKFWRSLKDLRKTLVTNLNLALSSSMEIPPALLSPDTQQQLSTSPASALTTMRIKTGPAVSVGRSSVAGSNASKRTKILLKKKNLVLALVKHEIERLSAWHNPTANVDYNLPDEEVIASWNNPTQSDSSWQATVQMAWQISAHLVFQLSIRFNQVDAVVREVANLVKTHPTGFIDIPDALQYLATLEAIQQDSGELYHMLYWRNVPPAIALSYFYKEYASHPTTAKFAAKTLQRFKPDDILFFIPQLVQALRYDKLGYVENYIMWAAKTSQLLAHQIMWNIQANIYLDEESKQKDPVIGDLLEKVMNNIKASLSGPALAFYEREFSFFHKITEISGIIRPYPKPERKKICLDALRVIELEPGVYLPSNPDSVVVEIDKESGTPMQSAAKAPFLAKFKVIRCGTEELENMNISSDQQAQIVSQSGAVWQACIFKVGDDVRQDMLALQIIELCKNVFHSVGLTLYLVPYRVVATSPGCGVIECVPDCKSRDQLGKLTRGSLNDYFHDTYGHGDSKAYQKARANFVYSMAAYSLVTYLLQIKDRHNGNIMITKQGHIVHIDFGFLFESSPGGNIGFEPDFKFTQEMLDVMGGKNSDSYKEFTSLFVRGYLAIRPYCEEICSLVTLMLDTGFPCFRKNPIEELRARFKPQLSAKEAVRFILDIINSAQLSIRAVGYDVIQEYQQGIFRSKPDSSSSQQQ